jgi:hypothetical protein
MWAMFAQAQTDGWKVLDPVDWPFIGIVGWSQTYRDMLQMALWPAQETPWQIDESWREILAATTAVKATRRAMKNAVR